LKRGLYLEMAWNDWNVAL